jgi:hypothetical protein
MNFFFGLLKKLGQIAGQSAPDLIQLVNPAIGTWVSTILNSVLLTEARLGPGNGDAKKAEAMAAIQVALPVLLSVFKATTGRDLADGEKLTSAIDKLIDGVVELLNAFRILPKKS